MYKRLLILVVSVFTISHGQLLPQIKPIFSGEPEKFTGELTSFMGQTLSPENTATLTLFIEKWDSSGFTASNKSQILGISARLVERQMRAVPHFIQFIKTLCDFSDQKNTAQLINPWLEGMGKILARPAVTNDNIYRYIQNSSLLLTQNILYNSSSVKWKIKNSQPVFGYDTLFKATVNDATLTCVSLGDSTEIYNVSGTFYPLLQEFRGSKGTVTWEKVGFPRDFAHAEITDYKINTTKNNFTVDSARLSHKVYFSQPVLGILTDQATGTGGRERTIYPHFETYKKNFKIDNVYTDVGYEGGLSFEGANVKGKGDKANPARVTFSRDHKPFIKVTSGEFVFSVTGLTGQETAATIYLDSDSIFHTNLGFSFNSQSRQVNLFRTNNPVSGSPYYDTYHRMDMYFESLSWDMNSPKIVISRPRGAAMGQAMFQSFSFFNSDYFMSLMNLDEYHPLTRLKKFSEYYYSRTFPVSEFAKWLNKPEDVVTGLCIDMANKGFVFYDRSNNEVTMTPKIDDFINAFAGKIDYDVLSIYSETKAPVDNAVLDLKDYGLTINGVTSIFLSDSQKVAVYPYNRQLTVVRNRSFKFDGVVQAGLFTIFGENFEFSYDTFKIRLGRIDSIKVAVETDKRDAYGNPVIQSVSSLIQLSTGELYIDDPRNKSGLRSLSQYPIINSTTWSYIFYDRIPGLKDVYKKKDFFFKVDPFAFENIDHYTYEDFSLSGEFYAGNILKPMKQYLTVQENNSLGFKMNVPPEGIDIYDGKGRFYDFIQMSDKGLTGRGTLKHLTSTTQSEEYKFFPDSMLTQAVTFNIQNDGSGRYPELKGEDVRIKWLPWQDEWLAWNAEGRNFDMFDNGTLLNGSLNLSASNLGGSGIINTPVSRVTSNKYTFSSEAIRADTADYNLKSASTNGYAFVAENVSTDINFGTRISRFHLNTDSSVVKFPEIQYICTMTDFEYDMQNRILNMEQRGKSSELALVPPGKLLSVRPDQLDKPTFFATNSLRDTISFKSLKAKYYVDKEFIEAEDISYIPIADALIQPGDGKVTINRNAKIDRLTDAYVAVNNRYLLHGANISIESTKRYSGSGVYDYVDDSKNVMPISFPEITVDTLTTSARGFIPPEQKFMLSPAFSFSGDVFLSAKASQLMFTGTAGIINDCSNIKSYPVKFKSYIDPQNVMIPISDKPRDSNDNLLYTGSYINLESASIYPSFLSQQGSWSDVGIVTATGVLYYNKAKGNYQVSSIEKMLDPAANGNLVALNRGLCTLSGEGTLNLGANFDLVKMSSAGNIVQTGDSGKVDIKAILALDFYFSEDALRMMSDEIRLIPSLKTINTNSDFLNKGMKDLLGSSAADQLKTETSLFGVSRNLPKEFNFELLLDEVDLKWNESTSSFRSSGKIGLGFILNQPLNIYVDGYVEIQRRRSGDLIDIYLKANESTWYYFSYFRGVMMAQSGNSNFNNLISSIKLKDRRHPDSSVKVPYTYMIAVEDRLSRFLRRMREGSADDNAPADNGLFR
jgi:hypothetical protein